MARARATSGDCACVRGERSGITWLARGAACAWSLALHERVGVSGPQPPMTNAKSPTQVPMACLRTCGSWPPWTVESTRRMRKRQSETASYRGGVAKFVASSTRRICHSTRSGRVRRLRVPSQEKSKLFVGTRTGTSRRATCSTRASLNQSGPPRGITNDSIAAGASSVNA